MIKRYSTALFGAFTITFFLFLGMHFLIVPEEAEKPLIKSHGPVIIGKTRDPELPLKKITKPEKIIDIIEPIAWINPTQKTPAKNTIKIGRFTPPERTGPTSPRGIGLANGDIQPLRKFAPAYPRGPQSREIEGYVIVRFTVNKMGAVENITIVESSHNAFERPSMRAVAKYKYKPRVIDGLAVKVQGVMEKISFKLEDS